MPSAKHGFRPIGGAQDARAAKGAPQIRLGPANFAPGSTDTPISATNARTISNVVSGGPEGETQDPRLSGWEYVFGQLVDHDLDLQATDPSKPLSIAIPAGDPDTAATFIPMNRAVVDAAGHTLNQVAGFLDLSQVYGSDAAKAASLRNADGTMKTSAGNAPPIVDGHFVAGDVRVEENPELVAATTLFVREHNRIVAQLHHDHPGWSGDRLYETARSITTAEYQNIVYSEYLPSLVGNAVPAYHGFDPAVNPQVSMEFATSAFRVGHTQVSGDQEGIDNRGNEVFSQTLQASFVNTPAQTVANGLDALLRHLGSDFSQLTDVYAVDALRNLLNAGSAQIDLIAIDVQRERDLGIGSLNQTRAAIGLAPYASIDQITSDPVVLAHLQQVFPTVDDVSLFIGGMAEAPAPGSAVGETFQRIIAVQFDALRTGDEFYWQNQGFNRPAALAIENTTLGDIISRNTGTPILQDNVFLGAQRVMSDVAPEDPDLARLVIGIGADDARIEGGPADDTIIAGAGLRQILVGHEGADVFRFLAPPVAATIADFNPTEGDRLDLAWMGDKMKGIKITDQSGDALLRPPGGGTITLTGITPALASSGIEGLGAKLHAFADPATVLPFDA